MHVSRESPEPSPRLRSILLQVGLIAAMLGLVGLVIAAEVPGFTGRLEDASPGWIAVAVVVELGACAAYAWLFYGVFSHGRYLVAPRRAVQIGLGELAGFVVSPTGLAGPALRIWALMRGHMPFRVVMSRSVVHYAVLSAPYVAAALVLGGGTVLGLGIGHPPTALALAPMGVVALVLAVAVGAGRLARRPPRSQARWRRIAREVVEAVPQGVRDTARRVPREPGLMLAAICFCAADCGVLVLAFGAVHAAPPLGVIVLAYMLGQIGNSLPLPGGVGGVEPAMLGVLTASGVDLAVGAAAVVLYRFISLGIQASTGAVAVATLIPSLQRERAAADAAPPAAVAAL